jgi:hypothetical protein
VSSGCPRCGEHESKIHVYRCQQAEAVALWVNEITNLHSWLTIQDIERSICDTICDSLLEWQGSGAVESTTLSDSTQSILGWNLLIVGGLVKHRCVEQQKYYSSHGSRKSGLKWATSVIRKIWLIAWEMWSHLQS